ncbi:MAG: HAD hydrolase-like protein [Microbacteriaceae bacterium]
MTIPTPTVTRTWTCILFDLDGTITDSAGGITKTLVSAFIELGIPVPDADQLLSYVGPPILDAFRDINGLNPEQALEALAVYRVHYQRDGELDSAVFPGIAGLIKDLHRAGIPLAVATSKPELAARRILDHFGLAQYFDVISGASEDESLSAKADVITQALERLGEAGTDLTHVVMVGDRGHDIVGAAASDIPTIMVEWGYGSPAESKGALAIVHSVDQLRSLLLS